MFKAFAGESQARNRYTFFSSQAKKEGYEQIAWIFADTADNEKEHAKMFFTFLEGGDVEIIASYPAGRIGTTAENLKKQRPGERMEWGTLYPDFAQIAEKEGFPEIARVFRMILTVETGHEKDTSPFSKTLKRRGSSRGTAPGDGAAGTADISTRVLKHRNALPAHTRRRTTGC